GDCSMHQTPQRVEGKRPSTGLLLLVAVLILACLGVPAEGKRRDKRKTRKKKAADASGFLVHPYLQLPTPTGMTVMWETRSDGPSRVEFGTTRKLGTRVEKKKRTYLHEVRLNKLKPATTYYYRVRSGQLTSEVYSFKTAPPVGTKRFRIAVYGDS